MSKLASLLRATMSGGLQLFNYRGKTERSRKVMPVLLGFLIGAMMLSSATVMVAGLKEDGAEIAILSLYTLMTAVIIVMEGVYKSGDLLFRPRDNDMLLAMPIKKSKIVLARMIKFYVFEMIYCLIFLLPAIIAYALNVEVGVSYYFVATTMLLLVPVIPIAISCIVGLITSAIATKFVKYKTVLQVVLSFAVLFVMAVFILAMNATSDFDGKSVAVVSDRITDFYYPAKVFVELVTRFDWLQYLGFVAVNLVVVAVTVLTISRFYFQIITRMGVVKRNSDTGLKYKFVKHSQAFAMVKKELIKYFSTPVLMVNTAMGLVLFLVAVGALCLKFDDIVVSLTSSIENFPLTVEEIYSYLPSATFALVAFASLMTFITATTISLEGKAFNLLKSFPISGRKVIMTKVLAAIILIVPVTIVGSVVMFARFQFGIVDAILILVGAVVIPFVTEMIGIMINLKYARFDAESDAVVVRQSASVLVATFLGLGMVLTVIPTTLAIVFLAGQTVGLLMVDAVFVIVAGLLCFVIATRGEERYRELVV